MKKILVISDGAGHGGSIKVLTWLTNKLSNDFDVTFLNTSKESLYYKLNDSVNYLEMCNTRNNSFAVRNTIGLIKNIANILKIVKKNKYNLIINFGDHAVYPIIFGKIFFRTKILFSQRVDPFSCGGISSKIRMFLFKYSDFLVCQTEGAQDYFSFIKNEKKKVIPNPSKVICKETWDNNDNDNYILSLARIDIHQKRQDVLIRAMKIVNASYPNIKLRFYGLNRNNNVQILEKLIKDNNLEGVAEYCGVTNDVNYVLSRAKMLVLTSDYEGIPNAIIDAMLVGVPIISTDCSPGGAKELIGGGDKGLVVEKGSAVKVAEAIKYYIENPQVAVAHANEAHKSLSRYREDFVYSQWKQTIDEILG